MHLPFKGLVTRSGSLITPSLRVWIHHMSFKGYVLPRLATIAVSMSDVGDLSEIIHVGVRMITCRDFRNHQHPLVQDTSSVLISMLVTKPS